MSEAMRSADAELRERLKGLIVESLKASYVSTSAHMGYKTGNLYQSVQLDDEVQLGFRRSDRKTLFDNFQFFGKTVIDCGCNIGELSRLARQGGAKYVDGIEYDSYFVNIARLINSYNGYTRISVVQGDLTNPKTFTEQYDVALAFSVFPYILPTLDKLSACVREVLVLETHNTTVDIAKVYLEPMRRFFPFYTFVGMTDFNKGEGDRAVIVFAKTEGALKERGFVAPKIDLKGSRFNFTDAFLGAVNKVSNAAPRGVIDLRKVFLALDGVYDDRRRITEGVAYWLDFIKGYLEFLDCGNAVDDDNSYVLTLRQLLAAYDFDPALRAKLSSIEDVRERVRLRFDDVSRLAGASQRTLATVDPIVAFNPTTQEGRYIIKTTLRADPLHFSLMDGYHRLMWASFFGYSSIPALFHYNDRVRQSPTKQ